jgi:hypothetical protein
MVRGDVMVRALANPSKGTALGAAELDTALESAGGFVETVAVVDPIPVKSALGGGVSTRVVGVSLAEEVSALEPAAADPEAENVEAAAGPEAPAELFA